MSLAILRSWPRSLWAALGALAVAGCGLEYPQSTIHPVTDFGEISHHLYVKVFWWTMAILAMVAVLLTYVLIRFRERPGQNRPKPIHGHVGLEIAWTVVPAMIVVAIVIPSVQGVFQTYRLQKEQDPLVVHVLGKRYWWSFHYPQMGVTTANELHLPVGRPVALRLESGDVIHSFWVPMLGGKRDVNPVVAVPEGEEPKRNWLYFTIQEEGVYWGQCAEFCGEAHSLMGLRVVAQSEEAFRQWVEAWKTPAPTANPPVEHVAMQARSAVGGAAEPVGTAPETPGGVAAGEPTDASGEDPLIARGREVFFRESYCVLCHAIQGTPAPGVIGPNLTRLGSRMTLAAGMLENNQENLERWIRDPRSVKPGAQMPGAQYPVTYEGQTFPPTNLNDEQIRALAAWLLSMK